jgi:hypothetical protein
MVSLELWRLGVNKTRDMALDLALIQRPDKPDLQFRPVRRGSSDQDRIDFFPLPTHCTAHKVDIKIRLSIL